MSLAVGNCWCFITRRILILLDQFSLLFIILVLIFKTLYVPSLKAYHVIFLAIFHGRHIYDIIWHSWKSLLSECVFTQPIRLEQDATQGQFLSGVHLVWIQSFLFSRQVTLPKIKCTLVFTQRERIASCFFHYWFGVYAMRNISLYLPNLSVTGRMWHEVNF